MTDYETQAERIGQAWFTGGKAKAAEVLREVVGQEWWPIDTAPKDGEPILIYKPDERMVGPYIMTAYWDDDHFSGEPGWVPVGGYNKQGYHSKVTDTPQGYPTHWMPLPPSPEKGEG